MLTSVDNFTDWKDVNQITMICPQSEFEFTDLCVEGEIPNVHRAFPVQDTQTEPRDFSFIVNHYSTFEQI